MTALDWRDEAILVGRLLLANFWQVVEARLKATLRCTLVASGRFC